jgi:hypothetical protein
MNEYVMAGFSDELAKLAWAPAAGVSRTLAKPVLAMGKRTIRGLAGRGAPAYKRKLRAPTSMRQRPQAASPTVASGSSTSARRSMRNTYTQQYPRQRMGRLQSQFPSGAR